MKGPNYWELKNFTYFLSFSPSAHKTSNRGALFCSHTMQFAKYIITAFQVKGELLNNVIFYFHFNACQIFYIREQLPLFFICNANNGRYLF